MMNGLRGAMLALLLASGSAAPAVNHAGVEIAPLVRPEGETRPWPLLGSAVVNRSFIPFYGLAMHAPVDALAQGEIGLGLTPLQITLVWYANALPKEQVEEHFRKLFFQVTDEETRRRIGNRLDKFLALLPPAARGQKIMFEYSPDGGMVVSADGGGREHFAGIDFNRGLLAMWLGPKADPDVRKGLTTPP